MLRFKPTALRPLAPLLALALSGAASAQAAPKLDTGDTAFMLLSAALVMLMTPGLAFSTAAWSAARAC